MTDVNQIVLQPASVDCQSFIEAQGEQPAVAPVKVVIVPIKLRLDSPEEGAYSLAFACNMQERCYCFKCIYARLKQAKLNKEFYNDGVSPVSQY